MSVLVSLLITLTVNSFCANHDNHDAAQGVEVTKMEGGGTDDMWDIMYTYTFMDNANGITFDGNYLWVSYRGVDNAYIALCQPFTGQVISSFPTGVASTWGLRDLSTDGNYVYGGYEGGLAKYDIVTHQLVGTIPCGFPRANAYDPINGHFYIGNYASTCYEITSTGTIIRQWSPSPLTAVTGMAFDFNQEYLYLSDQTNPVSGCNIWQVEPSTMTYTGWHITLAIPGQVGGMAMGLDYPMDPLGLPVMLAMSNGNIEMAVAVQMCVENPLQIATTVSTAGTITIPTGGGSFQYTVTINNNEVSPEDVDLWVKLVTPTGAQMDTVLGPVSLSLSAGGSITRPREQYVSGRLAPGNYSYVLFTGTAGLMWWDADTILFTKLADDGITCGESVNDIAAAVQEKHNEITISPNPCNMKAVISFNLQEAMEIKAAVYDITGREIRQLFSGWRSAGENSIDFAGDNSASGMYFVRVSGKGMEAVERVVLLK